MRLKDLKEHDEQLDEILPVIGAVAAGAARVGAGAARAVGSGVKAAGSALGRAAAAGVQKGGQMVANLGKKMATTAGGQAAASGLAGGGMDPAQAAAEKKQHDEDKRAIQAAIKEKQAEIAELQKQLASIG